MAHIAFGRTTHGPAVADEWLAATAAATHYAGKVSGRPELAVKLGPGFAAGAGTAQYTPTLLEIEVDTEVMCPGAKPEDVNPHDTLFAARHMTFMGALIHESAHARYSRWVPKDLMESEDPKFSKRMIDVSVMLEESRIEKRIIRRMGGYADYLASVVFDLIGADFKVSDDAYGAGAAAALTVARVDAGVLTITEAKPFRDLILTVIDEDTLEALRALWSEYHALPFDRWEDLPLVEMHSIATRWLETLGMDASDESGEGMACAFPMVAEGEGEGEGAGEGKGPGMDGKGAGEGKDGSESASGDEGGSGGGSDDSEDSEGSEGDLDRKVKDLAKNAQHDRNIKGVAKVAKIKADRRKAEREADAERRARGRKAADEAFPPPKGDGKEGYAARGGAVHLWRDPTMQERSAGMTLSRLMEKVMYSDRQTTRVRQEAPGGRLYSRGAMARAAQRAAGQRATAPAWDVRKRSHTDEPKLRVGVMLDVSGSMGAQARIASSLAYVVGNAVERNDGSFAMTLFGFKAKGVYRPGQRVDKVAEVRPADGTENFTDGFNSLDSMLDLVDGDGLRVLVLISDGVFVNSADAKYADAVLPMLAAKGVVVLHIDVDGETVSGRWPGYNPQHNNPYPPVIVSRRDDPVKVAKTVGEQLIALVRKYKGTAA